MVRMRQGDQALHVPLICPYVKSMQLSCTLMTSSLRTLILKLPSVYTPIPTSRHALLTGIASSTCAHVEKGM